MVVLHIFLHALNVHGLVLGDALFTIPFRYVSNLRKRTKTKFASLVNVGILINKTKP